ncbi:MAG: DUF6090 family protein [Eudoraea sp.]|uniref:DUF6090 family protein n=1 Tax=Eudoraea sp. TaxID=1979955 RepID=UPI003267391C
MLRFFRQIRQRLLTENKFSKYLLYAVGEILLVVIGILIALQVNNWNEDRINNQDLRLILKAVKVENQINIEQIKYAIKDAEHVRSTLIHLLANMGPDYALKDETFIDSLFFEGLSITLFDPNKAAFFSLLESRNLKLIKGDSLRNMLLEWNSKLDRLSDYEAATFHTFKTIVLPHFYDKISLVKIDRKYTGLNEDLPKSAFQHDNRKALILLETENIIEDHFYNLKKIQNAYNALLKDLKTVNQLIDKELQ